MTIAAGTLLGPYEIQTAIGAGGMGEVYRALDRRLERTVAIKVLPPELSSRPDLSERFEREARAISSLNHPHICTLHDVGQQDGIRYLVMEYIEGETLAERLKKGPLPVDQALSYAAEIADALDKAHRQGVTHRDLKPGNIILTKSGTKLLDFGLAKLRPAAPGLEAPAKASQLPTRGAKSESTNLTGEGVIVGTLQYMSPEQLEGLEADGRSDIFAFGAVFYEMLTGRRAFEGRSQSSVIAAIIHVDPPGISVVQPMTPPALDRIVRVCLAKDPDQRWQTAHDLALQLQWIKEGGSLAGVPAPIAARRRSRERLLWGLLTLAVIGITSLSIPALLYFRPAATGEVSRFLIETPLMPNPYLVSVSPDGRKVAFVGRAEQGPVRLFVRPIDSITAQEMPGTENAIHPFWSPDSRYIAFGSQGTLKKVESTGGPPVMLCKTDFAGGTWNEEGVIVFSSGKGLYRVSASGGDPSALTTPDKSLGETAHLWPYFLPDGRSFLYLSWSDQADKRTIVASALDSDQKQFVVNLESMPVFASGSLVFQREGTLFAQSFDTSRLALEGEPIRLAENIPYNFQNGRSAFAASSNGVLVYRNAADVVMRQLAWFDRGGRQLETVGPPGPFENFDLSPDGKRIVIWRRDPKATGVDLWTLEISNGVLSRFTFDTANDVDPVWSPDNQTIVFTSVRDKQPYIFQKVMGSREETPVFEPKSPSPWWVDDWSPDGRFLIGNGVGLHIYALPMGGDRKPIILTEAKTATYDEPHFSPDGRWITYSSNESGRPEIYIASFPEFKNIRQVSAAGGLQPRWRPDGKELFYLDPDRRLMSIEVRRQGANIETATAKPLFETRVPGLADFYEPSPDGSRFLLLTPNEDSKPTPTTVVLNWTASLK